MHIWLIGRGRVSKNFAPKETQHWNSKRAKPFATTITLKMQIVPPCKTSNHANFMRWMIHTCCLAICPVHFSTKTFGWIIFWRHSGAPQIHFVRSKFDGEGFSTTTNTPWSGHTLHESVKTNMAVLIDFCQNLWPTVFHSLFIWSAYRPFEK